MPDLLIELLSEEIPARMQLRAAEDLKKRMADGLLEAGLTYASAVAFSTPRRLALTVEGLLAESPSLREERKGPRTDAPEKAIDGFLRSTGVTREQLQIRETPKGNVYFATIENPGRSAEAIVADVLETVIRTFPWPKSMRWGSGTLRWVRPLRSVLCILTGKDGTTTVPVTIDGFVAGNTTEGHRFMAPDSFSVSSSEDYAEKLRRKFVMLDPVERASHIWADATNQAFAAGLEVVQDERLLSEVAGLVEWPVVLMGPINAEFLGLPVEVLQTSMREHQKFFSLRNPKTGRIEGFVTVANRETPDHGVTILTGNKKVLSARLADAKFFWENDLVIARDGMKAWLQSLDNVTFHNRLGTQGDRIARIRALARQLAVVSDAPITDVLTAAELAKADLSSEMVFEFPELQGVMGRYYIKAAGQSDAIAAVAQEHYSPLGPTDDVPTAPLSVTVALADKLDTLTGFWSIDEKPTGSKDPFALRRAALGVIRLTLTNKLRLRLDAYIDSQLVRHRIHLGRDQTDAQELEALDAIVEEIADHGVFGAALRTVVEKLKDDGQLELANGSLLRSVSDQVPDLSTDLLAFIHDRLKVHLREEGIRHDIIDACIAMPGNDDLYLLAMRAKALNTILETADGQNLLQGFKRANNILT